jgi:hypothetical protein
MIDSKSNSIKLLRASLENELNVILFSISRRRKHIVKVIDLKKEGLVHGPVSRFSFYEPIRETQLIEKFKEQLLECSLKEALAISLIWEGQFLDAAGENYPAWSRADHLNKSQENSISLSEMLNPLILKLIDKSSFEQLDLHKDFEFLRSISAVH